MRDWARYFTASVFNLSKADKIVHEDKAQKETDRNVYLFAGKKWQKWRANEWLSRLKRMTRCQ